MGKSKTGGGISFFLNLILWLVFLFVLAVSFSPLTAYLLRPLLIQDDVRQADVIVVLGAGIDRGRYLSLESSQRLMRAAQLYFEGRAKKILFCGSSSEVPPALVMAQEARRLNIPAENMVLIKGVNGAGQQAEEIKKLAEARRWKSLLLVTSSSRMKRALITLEMKGFKVYPASADPWEKYAAGPLARLQLFKILWQEYGGILYDRIREWL